MKPLIGFGGARGTKKKNQVKKWQKPVTKPRGGKNTKKKQERTKNFLSRLERDVGKGDVWNQQTLNQITRKRKDVTTETPK